MVKIGPQLTALLRLQLQASGPLGAGALQQRLGVSRPTITRALGQLGPELMVLGRGPSTRYALRRDLRGLGDRWPIYRRTATGEDQRLGDLELAHNGCRFLAEGAAGESADGWLEGLPGALGDARPQGFLGRMLAQREGDRLGLPRDPNAWSDDDILSHALRAGEDLPGDWIVGRAMLERASTVRPESRPWAPAALAEAYPRLAQAAFSGELIGSSAAGEQPKFTTWRTLESGELRAVLVKFSPPLDTPAGRRWADLLLAEHRALESLRESGFAAAVSRLHTWTDRYYLEVERFDRTSVGGRRGYASLRCLVDAAPGRAVQTWSEAADRLESLELLSPEAALDLRRLALRGAWIFNTDMHLGNMACWATPGPPFGLAPVYDFLPMGWAPSALGEIQPRAFVAPPLWPEIAAWAADARTWAQTYWLGVAEDPRCSPEFQALARQAAAACGQSQPGGPSGT